MKEKESCSNCVYVKFCGFKPYDKCKGHNAMRVTQQFRVPKPTDVYLKGVYNG